MKTSTKVILGVSIGVLAVAVVVLFVLLFQRTGQPPSSSAVYSMLPTSAPASSQAGPIASEDAAKRVTGTVTDATMNTLTIETDDGLTLSFSTQGADMRVDGLEVGMRVDVFYTGELQGSDTSATTVIAVEEVL